MFEQFVLPNPHGSQRWGLLVSLTGELLVLALMVIIPLAWTDHLPHLDWKTPLVIGAPPPARPAEPVTTHKSANTSPHLTQNIFHVDPQHHNLSPVSPVELEAAGEPPVGVNGGLSSYPNVLTPILPVIRTPPPPEKPKIDQAKPLPPRFIAVSKGAQLAKLIHQVKPIYPEMARANRVSGVVQLIGVISKDGTIRNLRVLSGHPWLVKAALDAVSQWVYRPTLLNGEPVEVTAPIEVNFILSQ